MASCLPPPPRQQPAGSYVHNPYALNNTFIVFQSNCKGHLLGLLSQSCHSSFLHNAIGFLHGVKYKWLLFTFQPMSHQQHQYSNTSIPSLPLYKWCPSFKALLYIHFHAFTHAADYA